MVYIAFVGPCRSAYVHRGRRFSQACAAAIFYTQSEVRMRRVEAPLPGHLDAGWTRAWVGRTPTRIRDPRTASLARERPGQPGGKAVRLASPASTPHASQDAPPRPRPLGVARLLFPLSLFAHFGLLSLSLFSPLRSAALVAADARPSLGVLAPASVAAARRCPPPSKHE